jgi:uncharacterized protein (DUF924 family)
LDFWFATENRAAWWSKSESFDHLIKEKFFDTYVEAVAGNLNDWKQDEALGYLALIITLDQFPRNMFRGLYLLLKKKKPSLSLELVRIRLKC